MLPVSKPEEPRPSASSIKALSYQSVYGFIINCQGGANPVPSAFPESFTKRRNAHAAPASQRRTQGGGEIPRPAHSSTLRMILAGLKDRDIAASHGVSLPASMIPRSST